MDAQVLLACGGDPAFADDTKSTPPLLAAADYYSLHPALTDVAMLRLMLESCTEDDLPDLALSYDRSSYQSLLSCAAGSAAATAYLLSPGVLPATIVQALLRNRDESGKTAADYACKAHNLGSLQLLHQAGALLR